MAPSPLRDALDRELRELHEDLQYTEKAHFAHADSLSRTHLVLGILTTLAAAFAAGTIVSDTWPAAAAVAALLASILAGVNTFLKPDQRAQQHLNAGRQLGALRTTARQVRNLDLAADSTVALDFVRRRIDELSAQKSEVDQASPTISDSAFERGRTKIKSGIFKRDEDETSMR